MWLLWAIAGVVLCIELLVKTYLRINFPYTSIPVIKNIFHITVVFNKGAAFGILQGRTTLLIYIGIIFILVFFLLMKNENKNNLCFFIASGLIIGGAVSNLCDRIFLGFVVDYIDLRIWPVFNLSDSGITVGAGLLLWQSYREHRKCKPPGEKKHQ